jgi:predicted metal-dependent phosphoesterase TrpH
MTPRSVSRADLHCHSTASTRAKLGLQRALGLPECATPPDEVYELAKQRGMDFVTITDHDTIEGCLRISDRPDAFISEELTAWFGGEEQTVHVLCYGITVDDHEALQDRAGDLEACVAYLDENGIVAALAHPFFAVAAPLEPRHRRRLAELFGIWEVRNGSRARELNQPAAVYVETNGAIGIGGSDDHAGVDIGRTWTETPAASTPEEFLDHLRSGQARRRAPREAPRNGPTRRSPWAPGCLQLGPVSPRSPTRPGSWRWRRGWSATAASAAAGSAGASAPTMPGRCSRAGSRRSTSTAAAPSSRWRWCGRCRPTPSSTASSTAVPAAPTSAGCGTRSSPVRRRWPPATATAPPGLRCCALACRRSRTRRQRASWHARRRSSRRATAIPPASRSSSTASARCTGSPTRSSGCASTGSPATTSRSSAPTRGSTAAYRRWSRPRSRSTPASRSGCQASPSWSRPSPRAAMS